VRRLPYALVVVLLLTLIIASLWLGQRSDRLRDEFVEVVSPANAALLRIQVSLAAELAAIRGYQLTNDSLYLARLRLARDSEAAASRRLDAVAQKLGPEVERAVAILEERRIAWSEEPEELLAGRVRSANTLGVSQQRLEAALIAADEAGAAVSRAEDTLVRGIGSTAWFERVLVILISLAALPVVLIVGWLSRHLAESESRFRQIAETLREMVWISDPALSTFFYVNPAYERIWQRPAGELYEDPRTFLDSIHRDDRSGVEAALAKYAQGDYRAQYRIERPDGEIRWISARAAPVRDEAGRIIRMVGTAQDITDRKRAEDERESLLERERAARSEMEAALGTRDRVLRIVSHDLKNPLHTIAMATELLDLPLPEEQRAQQLGIIRRTIARADQLVYDLLDAARIQSDQPIAVDLEPVEVVPLLDEVIEAFSLQAEQKHQRLEHAVDERVHGILADHRRIFQVLSNLVGNAVKFTSDGGLIRVCVHPADDDLVEFEVSDTGRGIAPEVMPHIFEPFTQARDGASLGTGLGLSIAKGIVEAHGGKISVESVPGSGTTFRFTLPRPPPETPHPAGAGVV
jgi:PAS domain S-box-containing protein